MKVYQTKSLKLSGSDWHEVYKMSKRLYAHIEKRTKRRSYIRSFYFCKQKIFLGLFWQHLYEKRNFRDKVRRLKYFPCALELIEKSRFAPTSKQNPVKSSEIWHRFAGMTPDKELFFVQIKEEKRTKQKWFISVFPVDSK